MTKTPQNTADSAETDRAVYRGADAAAAALSRIGSGADASLARTGDPYAEARARNTPVGARCDLEGVRIGTDPTPIERLPNSPVRPGAGPQTDDGTRIGSAHSGLHDESFARYDAARFDSVAARHAAALAKSGSVPPTLDLGVSSTYRKNK